MVVCNAKQLDCLGNSDQRSRRVADYCCADQMAAIAHAPEMCASLGGAPRRAGNRLLLAGRAGSGFVGSG